MCVHRDHHQRLPLEMLVGVELLEVAQGLLKEVVLVLKVRQDLQVARVGVGALALLVLDTTSARSQRAAVVRDVGLLLLVLLVVQAQVDQSQHNVDGQHVGWELRLRIVTVLLDQGLSNFDSELLVGI